MNLTYCFIPWSGRKYSHTNSYNSAITVIVQDDHLTALELGPHVRSTTFLRVTEGHGHFSSLSYIVYSLFSPWVSMIAVRG